MVAPLFNFLNDRSDHRPNSLRHLKLKHLLPGGIVFVVVTIAGLQFGFRQHQEFRREQQERSFLEQAEFWKAQQNYSGCITATNQIPPDAKLAPQAEQLVSECQTDLITQQLQKPQALVEAGRHQDAIVAAGLISEQARKVDDGRIAALEDECAQALMKRGKQFYLDPTGRLDKAIALLDSIPFNSRLYPQAIELKRQWQAQWVANQNHSRSAEVAMQMGNLDAAQIALLEITDHPFWNTRVYALIQQVAQVKTSQRIASPQLGRTPQSQQLPPSQQNETAPVLNPIIFSPTDPTSPPSTDYSPSTPAPASNNQILNSPIQPMGRINLNSITFFVFLVSLFLTIDRSRYQ